MGRPLSSPFPHRGGSRGRRYRLGSKVYHLPRHGFARDRKFAIVQATSASSTFRLSADDASFQVFPFRFELDVRFSLEGATLSVTSSVRNLSDDEMTASFGYHPAFRWPLPFGQPRSSHFIDFADEEPAPVRRLDPDGMLTPERHPTPISGRRLVLADSLFRDDVVIFDAIRSRSVSYGAEDGPRIRVSYPDAPYLGVWTKPGANFICIEPWHGVADPAGFIGDFTTKPGVFSVATGACKSIKMALALESPVPTAPM